MSIKNDLFELEEIKKEIKNLRERLKKLREREKTLETKISDYLIARDQPGVRYQGKAIILEEKEGRGKIKNVDKDQMCLEILKKYGMQNETQVLSELLEARKGPKEKKHKLKISSSK